MDVTYYVRCPDCGHRLAVVDTYNGSTWDKENHRWITRWFDPDWVLQRHLEKDHK